jgi:hypothetical protein
VTEPSEMFVTHVHVRGHQPVEVHLPIEWVALDATNNVAYSSEALAVLDDVRKRLLMGPL